MSLEVCEDLKSVPTLICACAEKSATFDSELQQHHLDKPHVTIST